MSVPVWAWIATLAAILAVLAVDLRAHRHAHKVTVREALAWSAVWLAAGTAFGAAVWASDYAVLPEAGLYKPIWKYDALTLARDLGAHLTYGAATGTATAWAGP